MIIVYFNEKEKYLKKDNYIKNFDVDTIEELLTKIKIEDDIKIIARSKDILQFKLKNPKFKAQFEIIGNVQKINNDIVKTDLELLKSGLKDYILYSPRGEYKNIFGEKVYLTKNKEICDKLNQQGQYLAISLDQLKEAKRNPQEIMIKNGFLGRVI